MKAFSITRVSTRDQKFGYGEDSQWYDDILENAPKLGLEVSENLRRNVQESATGWDRVRFGEAIEQALQLHRKGIIQAVVFPRVDRESRFVFSSMPFLSAMMKAGLKVYFARECLYLDPKDPEAVNRYLGKVAESQAYAETVRVNTMRGRRRRARDSGLLPTGGVNLYGYFYNKETGKRIVNPTEAQVIRRMVDYVLKDRLSLNEVCRRLMADSVPAPKGGKLWSRGTVGRILNNETYTGKTYALKMEVVEPKTHRKPDAYPKSGRKVKPKDQWVLLPEDTTPQIITESEFTAIQAQLARNRELSPRNQRFQYLLRGFLYCGECGRKCYGVPMHGKPFYRCSGRNAVASFGQRCNAGLTKAERIEAKVWDFVIKNMFDPDEWLKTSRDPSADDLQLTQLIGELESSRGKLDTLDKAETKLLRVFAVTEMSETKLKAEHDRIKQEMSRETRQASALESQIQNHRETTLTEEEIRDLAAILRTIMDEAFYMQEADMFNHKRLILEALGLKVRIDRESFTIDIKIPSRPPREYSGTVLQRL